MAAALPRAAAQHSAPVTDWPARIGWVVGLVLVVALVYWLMRQGWKWRQTVQSDIPDLPAPPEHTGEPLLTLSGRYHGSTTAGQWLDRIVAHDLGVRSRAELTLDASGLTVLRPGSRDFHIPAERLRGARLERGIAGKVLPEGGLLVVTFSHGDRLVDSGFRSDDAGEHPAWVREVDRLSPEHFTLPDSGTPAGARGKTSENAPKEGAR
ncbi:hypothetical protein ACFV3R_26160 [Streptomyces sp. NPDC059740]|uniref:PH-like domain-containing protein n=1 Tax=Streptomyces sp. NPDC059740 TaxID=3346926 RepID=UPI0036536A09